MLPRSWVPTSSTETPPSMTLASGASCTIHLSTEWGRGGGIMNKPIRGWLHPDQKITESGICYGVRYLGCLEVNTSMKSLDFDTRSLVAKECINRLCEAAGLKTVDKKRKVDKHLVRMLAEKPNMDYAGSNVSLTITSSKLNLVAMESGEMIANHEMPNISFASGGDADTLDFVSYVAKDNRYGRACFVLECGGGLAQDVITTIGQAFELRYKQFLKRTPSVTSSDIETNSSQASATNGYARALPLREDPDYYNDLPGKVPPDIVTDVEAGTTNAPTNQRVVGDYASVAKVDVNQNTVSQVTTTASKNEVTESLIDFAADVTQVSTYRRPEPEYVNTTAVIFNERLMNYAAAANNKTVKNDIFDMQPLTCSLANSMNEEMTSQTNHTTVAKATENSLINNNAPIINLESSVVEKIRSSLVAEPWYHGSISRQESETLVIKDGDFLVRESQGSLGQYVLTGMQGGQRKHLLLVDPDGVIRTKDHVFENISHLIRHHMDNCLPIVSAESALLLRTPVNKTRPVGKSIQV